MMSSAIPAPTLGSFPSLLSRRDSLLKEGGYLLRAPKSDTIGANSVHIVVLSNLMRKSSEQP